MDKRIILISAVVLLGLLAAGTASGALINLVFPEIPYNYTSYVTIPAHSQNEESFVGYYRINGTGKDFNFKIVLPGAENNEDPLCYTIDGLNGTGELDRININYNTVAALWNRNITGAVFATPMNGTFTTHCGNWTGYGNFSNNGTYFPGQFKIDGPVTDFRGSFQFVQDGKRIKIMADYVYYPHKQDQLAKRVVNTFYM
ncbi:hypothetical protein [Methanobacterium aggregans]|uniref:hypothetical protein n=1 Tax=Methanobacterium aggregans TaxID=1615586 RepID=UPI00321130B7